MKRELRTFSTATPSLEGRTLKGIAIPYNSLSHDLGGFRERFMPGSVTNTIQSGLIEAWTYHDRTKPLGSQAGGTLRLTDTPTALTYEIDLPDTSYANDLRALMTDGRKDIGGTSFGFMIPSDSGQRWLRENGTNVREVVTAELDHISPVVTPAYPQTTAQLRGLIDADKSAIDHYGIDVDRLAGIFLAANRGLEISTDEMELARLAIEQLRAVIRTPALTRAMDQAARVLL